MHKGGESAINYIKIYQGAKALPISVGNGYTKDNLMHTFLENLQKGAKYSAHIESHEAQLGREERFIDEKPLSISDL